MTLLPPNATPLERALEGATARLGAIDPPIDTLFDPATIRAEWLPWLAWGLSVDTWDADWTEVDKRAAVAGSIALHRMKGSRASVESVLARFDHLLKVIEWHEAAPPRAPHTFDILLPLGATGGRRATAAFAEAIVREVTRVKPLREHMTLVQALATEAAVGVQIVARPLMLRRDDLALIDDRSLDWEALLQTEQGEPIEAEDARLLDTNP